MPDRYFCPDCGYTTTAAGNCPTCNIDLIETDDDFEEGQSTVGKYSTNDVDTVDDEISGDKNEIADTDDDTAPAKFGKVA